MSKLEDKGNTNSQTTTNENSSRIKHWKLIALYLLIYDVIAIYVSYFLGLWLRFDLSYSSIPSIYLSSFLKFIPIYTIFAIIIFYLLRLYKSLWRFASFSELNRILVATIITTLFHIIGISVFMIQMPFLYYAFGAICQFILVTGVRFSYRYINLERLKRAQNNASLDRTMIIGAGAAGQMIIREMNRAEKPVSKPVCAIDDNPNKHGRLIEGIPVVGGRDSILEAVKQYKIDQIMFAIPSISVKQKRDILNICQETNCKLQILPDINSLINSDVSLSNLKPVAIEDLLGRDPIKVNMDEIFDHLMNKTILVTGGGGSIGSELCRQIASHNPKQLIIFDIYENNAYAIQQELKRKYGDALNLTVLIGSVRDTRRVNMLFEKYHPDIVYHAAAHKHVPLMEDSPNEAIKNNVMGTYKVACAALLNGTKRFVLISTDKAVNPTNVMGASKRICEMIIQSMDAISKQGKLDNLPSFSFHQDSNEQKHKISCLKTKLVTQFVAVRFGNVLGSNGSVVPLFREQIQNGGPVTVTHPDIIRYFMTIPEATSLVLQAGTYAKGGEIFVLDMGDPVKIDTLARNMIRLSGLRPNIDIKIEYTGLRPGEKLYEEKLMAEEGMMKTDNDLIHVGKPIPFDVELFLNQLEKLASASYENSDSIIGIIEDIVPTYHPVGLHPVGESFRVRNMQLQE